MRIIGWLVVLLWWGAVPAARAQDQLIYCNEPERIRDAGTYADARLEAGQSYKVFYHFRNVSGDTGNFVVQLRSTTEEAFTFTSKQGFADPDNDPPTVGRQAMARFLRSSEKQLAADKGVARFAYKLSHLQVASGVLMVRADKNVRLRIYFKHDKWDAPRMKTTIMTSPSQLYQVPLSSTASRQTFRIGMPERDTSRGTRLRDGGYGMIYDFKIAAPEGRKVRITFTPRGGKSGLVGILGGDLIMSNIYEAYEKVTYCETIVGPQGLLDFTTSPFGGVFYPIELTFQLL
jgi:hypothetical protein